MAPALVFFPGVTVVCAEPAEGKLLAGGIAAVIAALCLAALRRVRGTTLTAPAAWAVAAAAILAATELWLAVAARSEFVASVARYSAAMGAFCPLMAVVGAKRPQDRGWQWVVASLWLVLLVPVGQALTAPAGERLVLFAAWKLLLAALVAMGALNYLATRYAAAAAGVVIGQTILLHPFLTDGEASDFWHAAGLAALAVSSVLAGRVGRSAHAGASIAREHADVERLNRRWRHFRDGWGAFWGLRVLQRINQTAELSRWPVRLTWWNGFEPVHGASGDPPHAPIDANTLAHVEQTLDSLLRRFERLE